MDWASAAYTAAALACAAAATVVALGHIYRHLLHYAEPVYQRFIVRIIFMVPVMLSRSNPFPALGSLASDLSLSPRIPKPVSVKKNLGGRRGCELEREIQVNTAGPAISFFQFQVPWLVLPLRLAGWSL
jgi:hypothetical protein